MKQKISVIIPAYNSEQYIEKCLNRLIAQTYANFEAIVIDDGSVDRTAQICSDMAKKDNRVRLIKAQHGGVSKARNLGLANATGELVTFFDADDFSEPNVLEEYVKAYDMWGDSVSFVLCGMFWENYQDRLVPQEINVLEG